jgi:hypothetical protein
VKNTSANRHEFAKVKILKAVSEIILMVELTHRRMEKPDFINPFGEQKLPLMFSCLKLYFICNYLVDKIF